MLFLFVLFPVLLLTLYPFRWFQNLLNLFPIRWYVLHTFVDSFQGCYKDGTEPGTRDYRWYASAFLIMRYLLIFIAISLFDSTYFPIATMLLVIAAMLFVILQPFKENMSKLTKQHVLFIFLLALSYTSALGTSSNSLQLSFLAVLLYLSVIIPHWGYTNCTFGVGVLRRLQAKRHGYEVL